MPTFCYKTEQFLPIEIYKSWDFFSSPANLTIITPPELDLVILPGQDSKEIYEGMMINYTVKPLLSFRLNWKTEICKVKKPLLFIDRQLKGPYKFWEHTHTFIERPGGVMVKDEVKYKLPYGVIGIAIHSLIIRHKIENIFTYRKNVLNKLFVHN